MADGEADIIVAGSGPVGLVAALALSGRGFRVTLAGPEARKDDLRTTAIMAPALRFLETLGLREAIEAEGAALASMRIVDATARLVRAPTVTFHADEIGEPAFGTNIPNAALNCILEERISAAPAILWLRTTVEAWSLGAERVEARLRDGGRIAARLAVAADGRESPLRDAAGIRTHRRVHRQSALVLSFRHARDHENVSTELHTETGPFTQVPLPGQRSSLVWVVEPPTADELREIDDSEMAARIERRMQSLLGAVTVEPGRQVYPLSSLVPERFAAGRAALVGEAAHVFPPIGAQGLNLGIRDVADLVRSLPPADDPGAARALAAYDRRRRPDVLARASAVNLLNQSLLTESLPAQFARSTGLAVLDRFGPLRGFLMREGLEPGSGFAAALSLLRKQVGR